MASSNQLPSYKSRLTQELDTAEQLARRNASLVHAITYQEAIAGIFSPPPPDEEATSDLAGAASSCIAAEAGIVEQSCMC
jgi:hypothetical protein